MSKDAVATRLLPMLVRPSRKSDLSIPVLAHPLYSLTSSDYHLFGTLKETLRGRRFALDQELKERVHTWLAAQPKTVFSLRA